MDVLMCVFVCVCACSKDNKKLFFSILTVYYNNPTRYLFGTHCKNNKGFEKIQPLIKTGIKKKNKSLFRK